MAYEYSSIEPCWLWAGVRIWMLAKVIILTGLRGLQLLHQALAEKRPEGCLIRACWNADRMPFYDPLIKIVHASGDNRLVEEIGKAREFFSPPSLYEGFLLDANTFIKPGRAYDALFSSSDQN